jgi:hypothetical protein
VFEITFECNSLGRTMRHLVYVRLVLHNVYIHVCEKLQCMCLHMSRCVCFNKRGSKPVVYVHDTSLAQCSVESLIMLSLVFI